MIEDDNPRFLSPGLVDRVRNILTVLLLAEHMDAFLASAARLAGPPALRKSTGRVERFGIRQLADDVWRRERLY